LVKIAADKNPAIGFEPRYFDIAAFGR